MAMIIFLIVGLLTGDSDCLSQSSAEKILGQSAALTDHTTESKNNITTHKCTYKASVEDPKTHKTGNVYYMYEEYSDAAAAHKVYADIVSGNSSMTGQRQLTDLGEEAWLHTDSQNFHLIIFRKNNKMVRIKVNKVTSLTSLDEMKKTATALAQAM